MKELVQKAELVVEETVRCEWGPFPGADEARVAVGDAEITWSSQETWCRIAGLKFWLSRSGTAGADDGEWTWISEPWVAHRPATTDDVRELG